MPCLYTLFGPEFLNSGVKRVSAHTPQAPTLLKEVTFHRGDEFPAFQGDKGGSSAFPTLADFQVTLIQNNQYAMTGYLKTACPGPQKLLEPPDKQRVSTNSQVSTYYLNRPFAVQLIITFSQMAIYPRLLI